MEISVWELWLPILITGVALFFASAAAWMALPHHKSDWIGLPNEEAVANAIKSTNVPPGQYMFPYCGSGAEMKSESYKARVKAGPCGTLSVWEGEANMGANMACTVVYFIITSFIIAYLGTMSRLQPGDSFLNIFQFFGTAGLVTYASAPILNGIWFRRKMLGDIADGIAYGLIAGLIFSLMWPGTAA